MVPWCECRDVSAQVYVVVEVGKVHLPGVG